LARRILEEMEITIEARWHAETARVQDDRAPALSDDRFHPENGRAGFWA
jgi:hypothetical protein